MPPKLAPLQVVIVPIYNKDAEARQRIDDKAAEIINGLKSKGIRVKYDNDDSNRPGWKFAEYELRGIPVRIALGPRDLDNNQAEVARRDTKEKQSMSLDGLVENVAQLLVDIQQNMFDRALKFREDKTSKADTWDEFIQLLDEKTGFIYAHWDGTPETEDKIKELTKATIRCIPLNNVQEEGKCILTGNPSTQRVVFARAHYIETNKVNSGYYNAKHSEKPIFIKEITIVNESSKNVEEFKHNEAIFINVNISGSVSDQEKYSLLIIILDSSQNPIFSKETNIISKNMTLKIHGNFLVRGSYSISAIVYIPAVAKYDIAEDVCRFIVIDSGSEFAHLDTFDYGNVFGNANWTVNE